MRRFMIFSRTFTGWTLFTLIGLVVLALWSLQGLYIPFVGPFYCLWSLWALPMAYFGGQVISWKWKGRAPTVNPILGSCVLTTAVSIVFIILLAVLFAIVGGDANASDQVLCCMLSFFAIGAFAGLHRGHIGYFMGEEVFGDELRSLGQDVKSEAVSLFSIFRRQ
jgi:hypothetical protein